MTETDPVNHIFLEIFQNLFKNLEEIRHLHTAIIIDQSDGLKDIMNVSRNHPAMNDKVKTTKDIFIIILLINIICRLVHIVPSLASKILSFCQAHV